MKTFQQFQEDIDGVSEFIKLQKAAKSSPSARTAARESKHKERVAAAREKHAETLAKLRELSGRGTQTEELYLEQVPPVLNREIRAKQSMDANRRNSIASRMQRTRVTNIMGRQRTRDPHPRAMSRILSHE